MKNQWPFWLFLIVIVLVIVFSLNYQKKSEPVHLGEIFEEGTTQKIDYVYKPEENVVQQAIGEEGVPVAPAVKTAVEPVSAPTAAPVAAQPAVKPVVPTTQVTSAPAVSPAPVSTSTQPASSAAGDKYVIQVLASKDKASSEKALERVRKNGFESAYLQTVDLGEKGTWYRIYVGGFKTKTEADASLAKVKVSYSDAFVRSLK